MAIEFYDSLNIDSNDDSYFLGSVAIGITSPTERLDVVATSGNTNIRVYDSSANSEVGIKLQNDVKTWTIQNWGSGGDNLRVLNNAGSTIQLWDDNGKVGIGTTAPDEQLRVDGNVKAAGDFIGSALKLGFAGSANITTNDTNEDLLINPNGSGDILMQTTSTGNVGIGTASPARLLSVNGIQGWSASGTEKAAINPTSTGTDFTLVGDNGNIRFDSRPSSNSYVGTGNFGIGTTSPSEKLEVSGNVKISNVTNPYLLLNDTDAGVGIFQQSGNDTRIGSDSNTQVQLVQNNAVAVTISTAKNATFVGNVSVPASKYLEAVHTDSTYTRLKGNGLFFNRSNVYIAAEVDNFASLNIGYPAVRWGNVEINAATTKFLNGSSERMRLDSSGRLGIGTTSPSEKLHVDGNIRTNSTQGYYGSFLQAISSTGLKIGNDDFSGYAFFHNDSNVGIGTESPSEKLDVNGTVNLTNLKIATEQGTDGQVLTSTGSGVAWEDAGGGSGTVTSIVAGTGLTGGTITTSGTIALDYSGNNNFLLASGTQLTSAANDDILAIVDVNDARNVKYIEKEDLLEDQVTSVITGEPSGSDSVINIVSLTQAEYDAGTPVATTLYIIT